MVECRPRTLSVVEQQQHDVNISFMVCSLQASKINSSCGCSFHLFRCQIVSTVIATREIIMCLCRRKYRFSIHCHKKRSMYARQFGKYILCRCSLSPVANAEMQSRCILSRSRLSLAILSSQKERRAMNYTLLNWSVCRAREYVYARLHC
eukprot:SAG31_NODE_672_length_12933_cov_3.746143_2_plen_150_part_00